MSLAMPALTRRRDPDARHEHWLIHYGDVRVGHIGRQVGVPDDSPQWSWSCGFHPGCDPGEASHGTGDSIDECRVAFKEAWDRLLPTKTAAHFEIWRQKRDHTAWMYRMHDEHLPLPTQTRDGRARCFCGAEITIASTLRHIAEHHRPASPDGP